MIFSIAPSPPYGLPSSPRTHLPAPPFWRRSPPPPVLPFPADPSSRFAISASLPSPPTLLFTCSPALAAPGRSLTLHDARRNVFSRLAAPNSVDAALDSLARNYGVSLPLAELVTSSYDSLDWEIWIDAGSVPIPRQYSLTYKQLPAAPRFISTIQTWNDSPIAAGNLQLALPANAQAVDMVPVPR